MGLIDVVEFLLQRAPPFVIEATDTCGGKLISYAMEQPRQGGAIVMVSKLLELGADRVAPCTPSALAGQGWTPEQLARRHLGGEDLDAVLRLLLSSRTPIIPPPDPRLGLAPRCSGGGSGWVPVVHCAKSTLVTVAPPAALPPAPSAAPATLATPAKPATPATPMPDTPDTPDTLALQSAQTVAALSARVAALSARIVELETKLAAKNTPVVPMPKPLKTRELRDVSHMLRQWVTVVAPQERHGDLWRSKRTIGDAEAHQLAELLSSYYYPVLYAVMKRRLDDGMPLDAAVADVQKLKAPGEWKFISSLPKLDNRKKKEYKTALLALTSTDAAASTPLALLSQPPSSPEPPSPTAGDASSPMTPDSATSLPIATVSNKRILAFDPALSCGWALLEVTNALVVTSVSVGVIQVDGGDRGDVGARCNDLKRAIIPLMTPPPACVVVESYHGHARASDAISFSLRAVIAMETNARNILLVELAPQTWKSDIGVSGNEIDKEVIKIKLESMLGSQFPAKLPNPTTGRLINFRYDASDALGIALAGARQHHTGLSFASPLVISAPTVGAKRVAEAGASSGAKKARL
jgi:Holliday junction resolvasome RuvABC endonuclease subunit